MYLLLEPPPDVARTGRRVYVSFGVNCASLLCILECLSTGSMVINPDPPGWSVLMMLLFVAVDLPLLCLQLVVARSHSTVRTIATRRGLVCMGLSTRRLPWPSSRLFLLPGHILANTEQQKADRETKNIERITKYICP